MKCPECNATIPGGTDFCPACGAPAPRAGGLAAELREVASLAVDFHGQAKLLSKMPAARVSAYVTECITRLEQTCVVYGGTIIRGHSAGFSAVFGAPVAQEREVELAVRAAFAMRDAVRELAQRVYDETGERLAARAGVDFGVVRVGSFGGSGYIALGAPIERAVRLRHVAPLDKIILSGEAAALARGAFRVETVPVGGAEAAGRADVAYVVEPKTWALENGPATRAPFVGRRRELERLRAAFDGIKAGKGAIIGVAGDAGVGKSRLIEEAAAGAPDVQVFVGRHLPATSEVAYAALREPVSAALGGEGEGDVLARAVAMVEAAAPEMAGFASILGDVLAPGAGDAAWATEVKGEARAERLAGLLETIAKLVASRQPTAAVLEDVQWAGVSDLALATLIAPRVPFIPVLIIVTARDPRALGSLTQDIITLGPLPDAEGEELVRALAPPEKLTPELLAQVVATAQGNPAYIEAIAASLAVEGKDGKFRVPVTIKAAARARADGLTPDALAVAKTAACAGPQVDAEFLRAALPKEVAAKFGDAVEELKTAGIMEAAGTKLVFQNNVVREVLYDSLVKSERTARLEAVARAAATRGADPGVVAYYLGAAGLAGEAVSYLTAAGDKAAAAGNLTAAVSCYGKALRGLSANEEDGVASSFELVDKLAGALMEHGEARRALELLKEYYPYADKPRVRAVLSAHLGAVCGLLSDHRRALMYLEDAVVIYRTLKDAGAEADAWRRMAFNYLRLGDAPARRRAVKRALALYAEAGDEVGVAHCYNAVGADYLHAHDPKTSLDFFRKALAAWEARGFLRGQVMALSNMAVAYFELGAFREGTTYAERALDIARRVGTRNSIAVNVSNLATAYMFQDPARAAASFREAVALSAEIENLDVMADAYTNFAALERYLGRWGEARTYAARAYEVARRLEAPGRIFYAALSGAGVEIDAGNHDGEPFRRYYDVVMRTDTVFMETAALARAYIRGQLALARGDAAEAAAAAADLKTRIAAVTKIDEVREGEITLGELLLALGDNDGAAAAFGDVMAASEGEDLIHWPRAAFGAAKVCAARRQRDEARSLFAAAEDVFRRYGSPYWTDRVASFRAARHL